MPTSVGLLIEVEDDSSGEVLNDLFSWMRADAPRLRVEVVRRPVSPGEMAGSVVTALATAALSKELLGMVVTGIAGWLSARATTRRTKIRVKRGDVEIEIDTANVAAADEIARRLSRELGE